MVHRAYGEGALCRVGSTTSVLPALAVLGTAMVARHVVALADRRSESPGESRTRVILDGLGIWDVEPQVVIRDGDGRIVAQWGLVAVNLMLVTFPRTAASSPAEGAGT